MCKLFLIVNYAQQSERVTASIYCIYNFLNTVYVFENSQNMPAQYPKGLRKYDIWEHAVYPLPGECFSLAREPQLTPGLICQLQIPKGRLGGHR